MDLADSPPFSSVELENIYTAAFQLYLHGQYGQALELFIRLTQSDPYNVDFWKGLASCYQMLSQWDLALHAWALSSLLDETEPSFHYHAAECLHGKKEWDEALKALDQAKSLCKKNHTHLIEKINLLTQFCAHE